MVKSNTNSLALLLQVAFCAILALLVATCIFSSTANAQTAFTCDGDPITVRNSPSLLGNFDLSSLNFVNEVAVSPAIAVNGIGYNVLDDLLYGIVSNTVGQPGFSLDDIARVDANGNVVNLGQPTPAVAGNLWTPERGNGVMDGAGNWYNVNEGGANLLILDIGSLSAPGTFTFQSVPLTGGPAPSIFDIVLIRLTVICTALFVMLVWLRLHLQVV